MRKVWVVMQRGEELPDSVWTTELAAVARASELGPEEDALAQEYELKGEE